MTATTSPDSLLLDILLGDHGAPGPYEAYRRLRETAPAHLTGSGVLVLSRHRDCDAALRDRALGKADESLGFRLSEVPDALLRRAIHRFRRTMLFRNPPDHQRLRRLVTDVFTQRHIEQIRLSVTQRIDRLLDEIDDAGEVDIMTDLALPLPVSVIGDLLGLPQADRALAAPWVRELMAPLEPNADADAIQRACDSEDRLADYLGELIVEKRRTPGDDLLSRLATARGDDTMDDDECVGTAILLFAAGFETTTNLIGNGLSALLQHPDQLELLRTRPDLTSNAIDELLRFDAPVQTNGRTAMSSTTIAGVDLEPGTVVLTLLGAANRDPDQHTDPDKLDIERGRPASVSFGGGIHFCLGAPLARMEGQELFSRLLNRFPRLELSDDPTWRRGLSFRGLESLPVSVR